MKIKVNQLGILLLCGLCSVSCLQQNEARLRLKPLPTGIPALSLTPLAHDFGEVLVANNSATQTFTISNTGDGTAESCSAPSLSGAHSADFSIVTDNCSTNDVGALTGTCTIDVRSTPSVVGVRTATLSRTCTIGGTVSTTANSLQVTGVQPVLALVPDTRNFGNVLVGETSDSQIITFSNSGTADATGCAITQTGANSADFTLSNNTCAATLAEGASCSVTVTVTPGAAGARTDTIDLTCAVGGTITTTANQYTVTGVTAILSFNEFQQDDTAPITSLGGIRAVTVSSDGLNVYAAGTTDDGIEVFTRNRTTGALTHLETHNDGAPNGLDGITSLAISPDGRHVYAVSNVDNAIVEFTRTLTTGALTAGNTLLDGAPDGLDGASDVAVTPDGLHVYVVGANDNSLVAFSRLPSTGALTHVETEFDGVGTADGLLQAAGLAISPDGKHIYVASPGEDSVTTYARTFSTGALDYVQIHRDGVASVDGLDGARDLAVSPDGRNVYVAGTDENELSVFSRNPTTGELTYVEVHADGVAGVDGLNGVSSVKVSPNGLYVMVTSINDNGVALFARNPSTGALTYQQLLQDNNGAIDGMDGARDLAISGDEFNIYVAGETDNDLAVVDFNITKTGNISYAEVHTDGSGGITGLDEATGVAASLDGKNIYVTGKADDTLEVFTRNPSTGALTTLERHTNLVSGVTGLDGASGVAVSPDGAYVYVVGETDDAIATFSRNKSTGALSFVSSSDNVAIGGTGLDGANAVVVSADGKNVYVASNTDNAICTFTRDVDTGALAFSANMIEGVGGVNGIDGASGLALSHSGTHLYATGLNNGGLVVFTRDTDTGALTWAENHLDGVGGVTSMAGAQGVSLPYDDTQVLVTGGTANGVMLFTRDLTTGLLSTDTNYDDGVAGVDGLAGAWSSTFSSDGSALYITGETDNAVAVFTRNKATGALTYSTAHVNGTQGVQGITGARWVVGAKDGLDLYISGSGGDTLSVFDVD